MTFTQDQLDRIEHLAQTGDDFWQGAQWVIDHERITPQPPETPGASSSPKENTP